MPEVLRTKGPSADSSVAVPDPCHALAAPGPASAGILRRGRSDVRRRGWQWRRSHGARLAHRHRRSVLPLVLHVRGRLARLRLAEQTRDDVQRGVDPGRDAR